jgi:hypothetical protein
MPFSGIFPLACVEYLILVRFLNATILQQCEGQTCGIEFSQENDRVDHREVGVASGGSGAVRMDGDGGGALVERDRQFDEQRPSGRAQQRSPFDGGGFQQCRKTGKR